jgi:apolipoprotein N-acyltransferase
VQSAISGITAVIDADGVVQQRTQLFERTLLQTTVEGTSGETPYVRYGEWATFASLAAVAVAVGFGVARTARSRRATSLESAPV